MLLLPLRFAVSYIGSTSTSTATTRTTVISEYSSLQELKTSVTVCMNLGTGNSSHPCIDGRGNALEYWDVSKVTDMTNLFKDYTFFDDDVSQWNVGQVTSMRGMFENAQNVGVRRGDVSGWDVSSVTDMANMFKNATLFNVHLNWDAQVAGVLSTSGMFYGASEFNNGEISMSGWQLSSVTDMSYMFFGASRFTQDLTDWKDVLPDEGLNSFGVYIFAHSGIVDLPSWYTDFITTSTKTTRTATSITTTTSFVLDHGCPANTTGYDLNDNMKVRDNFDENRRILQNIASADDCARECTAYVTTDVKQCTAFSFRDVPSQTQNNNCILVYLDDGKLDGKLSSNNDWKTYNRRQDCTTTTTTSETSSTISSTTTSATNTSATTTSTTTNTGDFRFTSPGHLQTSLSECADMTSMTVKCQALPDWDVSAITDFDYLLINASNFNGDISKWNVSSATTFQYAFEGATEFNIDINGWDTQSVEFVQKAFKGTTKFNQPLGNWDVKKVNDFTDVFADSGFNQDISGWNTALAENVSSMFAGSEFNQAIGDWNVARVERFSGMFRDSEFNQDIGDWDTSEGQYFDNMFRNSTFNQDVSRWDLPDALSIEGMFSGSHFNQDLACWNLY